MIVLVYWTEYRWTFRNEQVQLSVRSFMLYCRLEWGNLRLPSIDHRVGLSPSDFPNHSGYAIISVHQLPRGSI